MAEKRIQKEYQNMQLESCQKEGIKVWLVDGDFRHWKSVI